MIKNTKVDNSYFEWSRPEMLEFIPSNPEKVLDVGCGKGHFGKTLKEAKNAKEVWGIELVEKAAQVANTHLDKVINKSIEDALNEIPDGQFDVIVFNDILEHLIDPYSIIESIKSKLKENGVVVASIPNVRHAENLFHLIIKKDWTYQESGIRDYTHLRFFTQKTIINLFEDAGYSIDIIKGITPIRKIAFNLLNIMTLGFFSDSRYAQFAVKAKLP